MLKTCGFLLSHDATESEIKQEANRFMYSGRPSSTTCTDLYTDCGVPILSSIPVVNTFFPRTCATQEDLAKHVMKEHKEEVQSENKK